ncbi:hypothetical protein PSN13_06203 [Micromonospora saelicesensis]|uniref:Uncharacterized protein n=1 Tax=Micromonospora saelicesensis TaxID=285676 RepID=A0A328NDC8_9ACTN|nr:hypothetical protein PSN13_06203 [Micromonospora saelicesensis]
MARASPGGRPVFVLDPGRGGVTRAGGTLPGVERCPGWSGTALVDLAEGAHDKGSAPLPAAEPRERIQAATTYGNVAERAALVTSEVRPDVVPVLRTRENITSGTLSARVRPLRTAKPKFAAVPTLYESRSG